MIFFSTAAISCTRTAVSKLIRIGITDKNDNSPYFDKMLYEAEVEENEDVQHTVLTVNAKDLDECKPYRYPKYFYWLFFNHRSYNNDLYSFIEQNEWIYSSERILFRFQVDIHA